MKIPKIKNMISLKTEAKISCKNSGIFPESDNLFIIRKPFSNPIN